MASIKFEHGLIKVSASKVSIEVLGKCVHLLFSEAACEGSKLSVSEIQEQDISGNFGIEVSFSEDTIIKGNCCGLID